MDYTLNYFDDVKDEDDIRKLYGGYGRKIVDCLAHLGDCRHIAIELKSQNLRKAFYQLEDFIKRLKGEGMSFQCAVIVLKKPGRNRRAFEFRRSEIPGVFYVRPRGVNRKEDLKVAGVKLYVTFI